MMGGDILITSLNKRRARSALTVLLTTAALALASGAPAQAAPDEGTASIPGLLAEHGSDEPTPDRFLADYRAGEVRTSSARARGISGCGVRGHVYTDCKIDMWVGMVQLAFRASYDLSTNQITSAYGAEYTIFGACGASASISRAAGDVARLNVQAQMCALPSVSDFWLELSVVGGSAQVTWNDAGRDDLLLWNTFVALGFALTIGVIVLAAIWVRRVTRK